MTSKFKSTAYLLWGNQSNQIIEMTYKIRMCEEKKHGQILS